MQLYLFLLGHLLGDFYLKNRWVNETKDKVYQLLFQSLFYTLVVSVFLSFYFPWVMLLFIAITLLAFHFMIEIWITVVLKHPKRMDSRKWELNLFILKQVLHFIFFYLLVYLFKDHGLKTWADAFLQFVFLTKDRHHLGTNVALAFGYLFLITPASVLMRLLLNTIFKQNIKPSHQVIAEGAESSGAIIGNLERLIVFTLGAMGWYSSIALVITAKSLARFKQLEDRSFAEKYLVGTLMSFLIALLVLALFKIYY